MSEAEFTAQRRQRFLDAEHFRLNIAALTRSEVANRQGIINRQSRGNYDPIGQGGICQDKLNSLKLRITAGWKIEDLKPLLADVVNALQVWNDAERAYVDRLAAASDSELRKDSTGLFFENLECFQMALEVASLGVLLGDGQAVRALASCVERYRGQDLLFESIVAPAVPDPRDNTDFFHKRPYDPLIDAFYTAETAAESAAFMRTYVDGWHEAFEDVSWHNGHLKAVEGEYMPYCGYWAFEAAAIAVIHDIDDISFRDHLVYPKDLADWARSHRSMEKLKPGTGTKTSWHST